ncbi:HEAT repeat domain-containing protein [Halarsenatibacter silvermanii]|uniref:HEAT repeat-containing protein n=1 Tax=Halarsenatibacter silvermanii TaxID=321763 RepID=A0A1G9M4M2_9FIRM|nr:HEAT repeat domain-containing protein [Halarsenatibacter silvermanii]SDL69209.1 HEAT repeat-containing protein [Halarsenatibacter silvermanii]
MINLIGLAIIILFCLIAVILGIILYNHWSKTRYNQKLEQKKERWEPALYEYLAGEKEAEELSAELDGDSKILKDFLMPYLKNLRGEDHDRLVNLARTAGVTDHYLQKLKKGSKKEKIKAANFLGKVRDKQALPVLKEILIDEDSDLMIAAAWAAAEIADKEYFTLVLKKVINETHMTYEGITELLTKFDIQICEEITELLSGWLKADSDLEDTYQSSKEIIVSLLIDLLGHFNYVRASSLLEDILKKEDNSEIIIHIFKALIKIGQPIDTDLEPYLQHENWVVRSQAVKYAGIVGEDKYLAEYTKLLKEDNNWWVKYYAGETILKIGETEILETLAGTQAAGSRMSEYILNKE